MSRQLLVAGRHPPEPLQVVEAALDDIPPTIRLPIELASAALLVPLVGDDRLDASFRQPLPQPPGRVRLIPGHLGRLFGPSRRLLQQRDRLLGFVFLPGPNRHGYRRAFAITDQVPLGAEAALAAAQGMVLGLTGRPIFFSPPRRRIGAPG